MYGLGEIDLSDPVSDDPLNDGLVSWWMSLENSWGATTLRDIMRDHHGTFVNAPTWAASENGFQSVAFDGDDYVNCGTAINSIFVGSAMSWEAAIYLAGSGTRCVASNDGGNGGVGNGFRFRVNGGIQVEVYPTVNTTTGGTTLSNGVWYHVAGTYAGGSAIRVYVNGVQDGVNTSSIQSSVATGSSVFALGAYATTYLGDYFNGRIAYCRAYLKTLSASEVAALYEQYLRGHPDTLRRRRLVARAPAAPAGNRRRRVIICGSR